MSAPRHPSLRHLRGPLADRFWQQVTPSDGCWRWQGAVARVGYGVLGAGDADQPKRLIYAHRASWELHYGPIPDGLCVLHTCDNRCCVNPAHLWLGTRADNIHDMIAKGRAKWQGGAA